MIKLFYFSIENVTYQWSSCVIDLVNWANKAGDKEEGDKDSGADPDDAEVWETDVLAHRLSGVVVAVVIRAETPIKLDEACWSSRSVYRQRCRIGWSEKPKSLKSKNGQADYLPRHSLDVRTVFEI